MNFIQYTQYTVKLLFCVLLSLIPVQKTIAIDIYIDLGKATELGLINAALSSTASPIFLNKGSIFDTSSFMDKAGNYFGDAGRELSSISNTLDAHKTSFSGWQTSTDPSTVISADYVKNITDAKNKLEQVNRLEKEYLSGFDNFNAKDYLGNLEKNNFDNSDAFENSALQYSQGNRDHKTSFEKGILCPGKPEPLDITKNYSTLQYKACTIVNNATAYKIKLFEVAQKKQTVIDSAITDILKKSPKTMGDFEARRVALSALQTFQKNVIDGYDLKAKNADLQIKIAEEARRYASEAMLVGPAKTKKSLVTDVLKNVLAATLNTALPATIPYNE